MTRSLEAQHLLIAAFFIFLLDIVLKVFAPSITASAAAAHETNFPLVVGWALPVIAIVAIVMFYSHKAICASGPRE